ncbi:transglutaminase domain-containing protein [Candidatus Dojkabacteria bacterium]|nr:transglutaminase domain-containing protein [Candidatus Dojkabacteria bacterium]
MKSLSGYLKRILLLSSLLSLFLMSITTVNASETLTRTSDSSYSISKEGSLSATYKFTLSQKSSIPTVITNFSFLIPFDSFDSLSISVNGKIYKYSSTTQEGYTKIFLNLPNIIIQRISPLTVSAVVKVNNHVVVGGENFYILIPSVPSFVTDSASVEFPSSWGGIAWSSVEWEKSMSGSNTTVLNLKKDTKHLNPSIAILLGEGIGYNLTIKKELSNTEEESRIYKISLPREGDGQHVLYTQFSPTPFDIETDNNSNINISYMLKKGEEIAVAIEGLIYFDDVTHKVPSSFDSYLNLDEYWHFTDESEMKRLLVFLRNLGYSDTITEAGSDRGEYIDSIYNYVLGRMNPSTAQLEDIKSSLRRGNKSLSTIVSSGAYPDEYTDLLIALLRSTGVPARMVIGYISPLNSYQKGGFFHSWAEYWDIESNRWITLDPALEDFFPTRFIDTHYDHIAFVTRSKSSVTPQTSIFSSAELSVEPAQNLISPYNEITTSFKITEREGNVAKGILTIKNSGNRIYRLEEVQLKTDGELIKPENLWSTHTIVPGAQEEIELVFTNFKSNSDSIFLTMFSDMEGSVYRKTTDLESSVKVNMNSEPLNLIISFGIFSVIIFTFKLLSSKIKNNG